MTNHPIDEAAERVRLDEALNKVVEAARRYERQPLSMQMRDFWTVALQAVQGIHDATLARARLAAEREAKLREALEYLIERADDSDSAFYGTLSTGFVRDTARAALDAAIAQEEGT